MKNAILHWCPVALGVLFLLGLAYVQRERVISGQNDFVGFYSCAKLAGTPDLYSRPASLAIIRSVLGFTLENVTYIRPPFYASLLKPLSLLPYRWSYAVFSLVTLSCILWFVVRFSKECPALPFFAAMSIPVLTSLCNGQDTPFLLAILGVSMLLVKQGRDFLAGLVLSLCAIKFHLFLFLPILVLLKRRWSILGGGACGIAILTGFGILVNGLDALRQYVKVLRDPWINPPAGVMPNLHGLVAALHGDFRLELALVAAVLVAFLWTTRRTDNWDLLFGASLVCGLLVSFHSSVSDAIILLPAFVSVAGSCASAALRSAAALILTPIPYFMVFADAPYSAAFPISLLLIVGMFCTARRISLEPAQPV